MRRVVVAAGCGLVLVSLYMAAQSTPATPPAAPTLVDPVLTKPLETVTAADLKRLQSLAGDYAQLDRYAQANAQLGAPEPGRVVFYGDSITDAWGRGSNPVPFFPGKPYVNRGISGQTTPQMLIRFQQDVVALKPAAVLILAGTNDIAGNTGVSTLEMTENNFRSMAAVADANKIKVILASTLPVDDYPWRRGLKPAGKIRTLNAWMKDFCAAHGYTYLDYYTALATPDGGMKPGTAKDGVHPTAEGYAIMAPLARAAIDRTLGAAARARDELRHVP